MQASTDLTPPKRALAIGAHPDDIEFGCGGTLAKWARSGCEVSHLVCTDGSKGSWDPATDTAELVKLRQAEQRQAAKQLGANGQVVFLGWPDGELASGTRQVWQICHWIRTLKPDVVLGHDPWKRYRLHPDHRNAGFMLTDGIVAARDPHFFPEQGAKPHRPGAVLLWEADEADHYEDIADFMEVKFAALMKHRSQLRSTMSIDDPNDTEQQETFREKLVERSRVVGSAVGLQAAEAFKLIDQV